MTHTQIGVYQPLRIHSHHEYEEESEEDKGGRERGRGREGRVPRISRWSHSSSIRDFVFQELFQQVSQKCANQRIFPEGKSIDQSGKRRKYTPTQQFPPSQFKLFHPSIVIHYGGKFSPIVVIRILP